MILIGTDEGIYRWFEGAGWPTFHSLQDREVVALASPGGGVLAAVDRTGGVFESVNNGLSWRALPLPAGAGKPSTIAFDGAAPRFVVAVKPLNIYRRPVGAPVPRDLSAPPESAGFAPKMIHHARGLAGKGTALLAPSRSRVAPTASEVKLAGWAASPPPNVAKATVAPEVRVLEILPGAWFAAVSGAGLWKSGDNGKAWTQCAGLPSEVYAVRAVPGRPGHVWIATHEGCRFSADSGQTWEDRSSGLENVRQVRAFDVKPGEPDTLLAGAAPAEAGVAKKEGLNYALYESTNAGKTWAPVTKKTFPDALEYDAIADIRHDPAAPDNVVVALGSGELWVTRNGGAYWSPLARQTKAARVLCAVG